MAATGGPKTVQAGLLFSYDQGNLKSWKGAPTTNIAPTVESGSDLAGRTTKTVISSNEVRWVNDGTGQSTLRFYVPLEDLTSGNTYGLSVYAKDVIGIVSIDWCDVTVTGAAALIGVDGRMYGTSSRGTYDETYRFLDVTMYTGAAATLYDLQIEETRVTPFTPPGTSRTVTTSLLDLTNSTELTLGSNVSYTDNIVKFQPGITQINGISIPLSTSFNKQEGTLEFWINADSYINSNGLFVNRDSSASNALNWVWFGIYGSGDILYLRIGDGVDCCSQSITVSDIDTLPPPGTWGQLAATWKENNRAEIYLNGENINGGNIGAIPATNPTANGTIGVGHLLAPHAAWDGRIDIAKIYNRQLTHSEIKQNFEATRSRFGI